MAGGRRRLCWGDSGVRRRRRRRSRRQLRCRSGRRSHRRWTEGGRWQRDGWAERVVGKEARPRVLDERRPVERLNGIAAAAAAAALGSTTFAPPAAFATTALTALAAATLATAAALAAAGHVHPIGAVRLNRLHHWRRRQVRRPRGKGRRRSRAPRRHGRAQLHGAVRWGEIHGTALSVQTPHVRWKCLSVVRWKCPHSCRRSAESSAGSAPPPFAWSSRRSAAARRSSDGWVHNDEDNLEVPWARLTRCALSR